MADAKTEKWTEIEHLPQWDEEFYSVYTAKKHGKWVMLKTLRPEYRDEPKYIEMIEKEFDTRYNLAHPNIVMINDFEEIPGLGQCIITDDVYGKSLRAVMEEGKLTDHHLQQILHQMVNALDYIQTNHIVHYPIRPETIIFTENIENLKLIDVGFDQRNALSPTDVAEDIYNYGVILRMVLDKLHNNDANLRRIANKCISPNPKNRYRSIVDLRNDIEGRSQKKLLLVVFAFMAVMIAVLVFLQIILKIR